MAISQDSNEPVATVEIVVPHLESIVIKHILGAHFPQVGDYLYTHPPRREWRGLGEEDFDRICDNHATLQGAARAIEQALRSKNT